MPTLTCDDAAADACLPPCRPWTPNDGLTPQPPDGWLVAYAAYSSRTMYYDTTEVGVWLILLDRLQHKRRKTGRRAYMIARDPAQERYLLVHPSLADG